MPYDLRDFQLGDMTACTARLRRVGDDARSPAEVAERTVRLLHKELIDPATGEPACALVRFFKTHPFEELDPELQSFACGILGTSPESGTIPCLTLLATAGDEPDWNSRHRSVGHKAIPLASKQVVEQSPMISQLMEQCGFDISALIKADRSLLMDQEQKTYNVFHVPQAAGSPYVPAQQEFVIARGIESVLGFGGLLPTGQVFSIILFSKVPISRDTARMFRTVALSVKVAALQVLDKPLFG